MADENDKPAAPALPDRRARLEALKAKRQTQGTTPPAATPAAVAPMPATRPAKVGGGGGLLAGGGGRKRKMLIKLVKIMAGKPGDPNGFVEGTPFTNDGVTRLMDMLNKRSSDPTSPGSKMSKAALAYLSPRDGEAPGPGGASLDRLHQIASQVDKLRNKRQNEAD